MQGSIIPSQPINNLYWTLETLIFDAKLSALTVYINLYLSEQDRDNRKVLCNRAYKLPLEESQFLLQGQQLVSQLLNTAVASDGEFNLSVDP